MSLAGINDFYKLETISVSPDQLFLDPSNPRLIVDIEDDVKYPANVLISDDVQNDVLSKIGLSEFKVDDLVRSITEKGFMNGAAPLIVKKIDSTNKFVVLEGNRRTAAIKKILRNSQKVDQKCLKTLQAIQVSEFTFIENNKFSEEQIVNIVLGQIHVGGALDWGAMERAHYIYRSYMMEIYSKKLKREFVFDEHAIKHVSDIYSFKPAEIKTNLKIYRVFEQIKESGFKISSDKFSLLDIAVTDSTLSSLYFDFNNRRFRFSEVGIEKFIDLINPHHGPIKNPKLFRQFSYIVKNGTEEDIRKVERSSSSVSDVHAEVQKRKKGNLLHDRLTQIYGEIKKLDISDLANLDHESSEFKEAKRIVEVVVKKIYPLIEGRAKNSKTVNPPELPSSIDELLQVNPQTLRAIIRETLSKRPNRTCVGDPEKLCGYSLNYLGIVTKGTNRNKFMAKGQSQVVKMIKDGIIQVYSTGTNSRYKLIG